MPFFSKIEYGFEQCSSSEAQSELQDPVEISIPASESLNPTKAWRASPMLLRAFELAGPSFFQSADLVTLLGEMSKVQHAEVVEVHEFGEIRALRRRTDLVPRFLGVAAGYRDLEGSAWWALRVNSPADHQRSAGRVCGVRFSILIVQRGHFSDTRKGYVN